jgi:hypothetical protein
MKFSKCDRTAALANVRGLLGLPAAPHEAQPRVVDAVYQYPDALGGDIVEKIRFRLPDGKKKFCWRRPDGKGGHIYGLLPDFKKRLYRLPELVRSAHAIVCEGEKDAINVANALARVPHLAVTTSPDGAADPGQNPQWPTHFGTYFTGKVVAILADNDSCGAAHAEAAAKNIYPYAAAVRLVLLPNLPEHGDVSDFLVDHTGDDLLNEIKKVKPWKPSTEASAERYLSVPAPQFCCSLQREIDWLVERVIQRGANGYFCAVPKGGKSWAAADLAISVALGSDWLGFPVPRPGRVLFVSREDNPALTSWRIRHLFAAKSGVDANLLEANLHINSRAQTPELMLDNPEQVEELRSELKRLQIDLLILDVFNVLHAGNENDNQDMRRVLRVLTGIQTEFGCSIAVVHHYNKGDDSASMTQRLRGSSAIAGWAEWLVGISMVDEENKIRCLDFELKAAQPPDSVNFRIVSNESTTVLQRVAPAKPSAQPTSKYRKSS